MDTYLIIALAVAAALALYWWTRRRRPQATDTMSAGDRLDTLVGWPPEATRVLRTPERLAYSTLKLALPGYMILAQVPIARFVNVPKRNSYAEWMRRLGSQCADFVVCDVTSQVVAVIEVRAPDAHLSDRLRRRNERVTRTLHAVGIPLHVWNEEFLPSVEAARASIVPEMPAVPFALASRQTAAVAAAALVRARTPFESTNRHLSRDEGVDVIEMAEPRASTWFDELDSVPPTLPAPTQRSSSGR